ncbi:MAG: GAF domain-containing protein [Planctomycetota bacterium]|nr:MAG: GAF domain-containing protein [Planctomycetota bacterium]
MSAAQPASVDADPNSPTVRALLRNATEGPHGAARCDRVLALAIEHFRADSGTVHLLHDDGVLHLAAASRGIPEVVLAAVRTVPVGKGMAGLAVERAQPVDACNLQTDTSGDVRPGAKATGLQGAIVVPILRRAADGRERAVGAFGIANRAERTFSAAEQALLVELARTLA